MSRIRENDLRLPALYIIEAYGKANTSTIKRVLLDILRPTGEDAEPLAGRSDTKFTQIVRNLMGSHYQTNSMCEYTQKSSAGYFSLTAGGQKLVDENRGQLQYLFDNTFSYEENKKYLEMLDASQGKKRKLVFYSEDDTIEEGKASVEQKKAKERSRKLREAAIQHYTINGKIACAACGFDFFDKYGSYGDGYIQIHHEKPICQYSDEGVSEHIKNAIEYVKPLCANCHCILHRRKANIMSVAKLAEIIKK